MRLRTVDAFTEKPFTGNPAAVVMLDEACVRDRFRPSLIDLGDEVSGRSRLVGVMTRT